MKLDGVDQMLHRMATTQIGEMEERLAICREIIRRSMEEPDPAFTEELVERCTREATGLQDRIEILRLTVPAPKPKRRWFKR